MTAAVRVRHLDRIREAIRDAGADALWVHPAVDFRYLTGLAPLALERPTALVILAGGDVRVLAPLMLAPELEAIEGAEVSTWADGDGPEDAIARVLDGVGRCLIDRPPQRCGVRAARRPARARPRPRPGRRVRAARAQGARRGRAAARRRPRGRRGHGVGRGFHARGPQRALARARAASPLPAPRRRARDLRAGSLRRPLREPRPPRSGRPRAAEFGLPVLHVELEEALAAAA